MMFGSRILHGLGPKGEATLSRLYDLDRVALLIARDEWNGYSAVGYIAARYELRRERSAFRGSARFHVMNRAERVLPVEISVAVVQAFLESLGKTPVLRGQYTPGCDHTDDYPELEVALHGDTGCALLYTESQGPRYATWGATVGGEAFRAARGELWRGWKKLRRALGYDELDRMCKAAPAGE